MCGGHVRASGAQQNPTGRRKARRCRACLCRAAKPAALSAALPTRRAAAHCRGKQRACPRRRGRAPLLVSVWVGAGRPQVRQQAGAQLLPPLPDVNHEARAARPRLHAREDLGQPARCEHAHDRARQGFGARAGLAAAMKGVQRRACGGPARLSSKEATIASCELVTRRRGAAVLLPPPPRPDTTFCQQPTYVTLTSPAGLRATHSCSTFSSPGCRSWMSSNAM